MSGSTTLSRRPLSGLLRRQTAPTPTDTPPAPADQRGSADQAPPGQRGALGRLFLGKRGEPAWARPLLWVLLLGTAAIYLVDIANSGSANSFYAAAVKSGTESLKAWLFGSLDAGNSITVDKPPAALWVMVLSARIFGFSSASMLVPQALMGVGTVALTYAGVKRWFGPAAGLIAGALIALTPVAALMFRFNNPDAFLVFSMTLAAYAVIRAVDTPRRALRWLVLAGTALGFAFLTKLMQGMLVLPAFAAVYLVASPNRLGRRLLHLLGAAVALIVSAGWFVLLVELWPASARPYIGGSSNNSLWELALGYNGLSRILGGAGNGGGGGGGGGFGGESGLLRMFNSAFAGEISWLLPAALIALVAGLVLAGRAPRTDKTRAAMILWGGWLVVSALVFSFMSGTIHPYYTVALAPAIGATIAITATLLWQRRDDHAARGTLAVMIAATAIWGCYLMGTYAAGWVSWVRWTMLVGGVLGAAVLAMSGGAFKRFAVAAALVGSIASLGGTAAYTVATVTTGHTGSIPSSGPAIAGATMGGGMRGGMGGGPGGAPGQTGAGQTGAGQPGTGSGSGSGSSSSSGGTADLVGMLNETTSRWSAAVVGDQSAAGYILSTNTAVMAIGGWSGSDDSPTLAQFQAYVANGDITYFIAGGDARGGGMGGASSDSAATQITAWVEQNFTSTTVGGVTVYDLTSST
ncbi:ArnT family glycosyltransferase [Microlunatus ginsengisoli]|uniref:Glycosyltransferase family 39 protein n=1 Tax=Microlunatus ginsengisoli TaxID=363863 RepID=A0ABP7AHV2_9ACTN